MPDAALLAFNFLLGVQAFFSPCGFPMLPAYLAYYLPREGDAPPSWRRALARGFGGGALAALGALLVLGAIGGLAVLLGAPFKERVVDLELAGGVLVLGLGIVTLAGKGPSFKVALQPSQRRSALALVGFGALYALVAASCVAPIVIGVLFQAFAAPTLLEGALIVGAYAVGLAGLLLAVTVFVATGQHGLVRRLKRALPVVEKLSGAILILVGLYLIAYWVQVRFGF